MLSSITTNGYIYVAEQSNLYFEPTIWYLYTEEQFYILRM